MDGFVEGPTPFGVAGGGQLCPSFSCALAQPPPLFFFFNEPQGKGAVRVSLCVAFRFLPKLTVMSSCAVNRDPRFITKHKGNYWYHVFQKLQATEIIRLRLVGETMVRFLSFVQTLPLSLREKISRVEFWDTKTFNQQVYNNVSSCVPNAKIFFLFTTSG